MKSLITLLLISILCFSSSCSTYKVYKSNQPHMVVERVENNRVWMRVVENEKSFWRKTGEYSLGVLKDAAISLGVSYAIQEAMSD